MYGYEPEGLIRGDDIKDYKRDGKPEYYWDYIEWFDFCPLCGIKLGGFHE